MVISFIFGLKYNSVKNIVQAYYISKKKTVSCISTKVTSGHIIERTLLNHYKVMCQFTLYIFMEKKENSLESFVNNQNCEIQKGCKQCILQKLVYVGYY